MSPCSHEPVRPIASRVKHLLSGAPRVATHDHTRRGTHRSVIGSKGRKPRAAVRGVQAQQLLQPKQHQQPQAWMMRIMHGTTAVPARPTQCHEVSEQKMLAATARRTIQSANGIPAASLAAKPTNIVCMHHTLTAASHDERHVVDDGGDGHRHAVCN